MKEQVINQHSNNNSHEDIIAIKIQKNKTLDTSQQQKMKEQDVREDITYRKSSKIIPYSYSVSPCLHRL